MSDVIVLLIAAVFTVSSIACGGGAGDGDSTPSAACTVETITDALTPGYASVAAAFGFSYEEIYVVGHKFHRYGVTAGWQEIEGIEDAYYADIWGSSPSDIFLVGAPGIHHYDGSKVEPMEHPQLDEVTVVWGTSSSNVYALGYIYAESHNLLRYDGHEWTMEHTFGEDGPEGCWFKAMWGTGEGDIWAGGDQCLLHFDGSEWSSCNEILDDTCGYVSGIWGTATDDVYFVGGSCYGEDGPLILHYNGDSFDVLMDKSPTVDEEYGTTNYALKALWIYGPDSILALGAKAAYFDGKEWSFLNGVGGIGAYGESSTDTIVFGTPGSVKRVSCQ